MLQFRKSQRIGMSAFSVVRGAKPISQQTPRTRPHRRANSYPATPRRKEFDESKFDTAIIAARALSEMAPSVDFGRPRFRYQGRADIPLIAPTGSPLIDGGMMQALS
jgi:hypothetical protein